MSFTEIQLSINVFLQNKSQLSKQQFKLHILLNNIQHILALKTWAVSTYASNIILNLAIHNIVLLKRYDQYCHNVSLNCFVKTPQYQCSVTSIHSVKYGALREDSKRKALSEELCPKCFECNVSAPFKETDINQLK